MSLLPESRRRLVFELALRLTIIFGILMLGSNVFYGDVYYYWSKGAGFDVSHLPYRDFLWEYPPLTVPVLSLIPLSGSKEVFWAILTTVTLFVEYFSFCWFRKRLPMYAAQITKFWNWAVLPSCAIAYFRFDLFPMVFAVFAVSALLNNKNYKTATVLGFLSKLWPAVFVGIMLLQRSFKQAIVTVFALCLSVVVWFGFSPSGFKDFLHYREGAGFQVESIPGVLLLWSGKDPTLQFGAGVVSDAGWQWLHVVMTALLVLVPAITFLQAWKRRLVAEDLIVLAGLWVLASIMFQRLLSPQFLVWLAPFVAIAFLKKAKIGFIYGAATWATALVVQNYHYFIYGHDIVIAICCLRNTLLLWLGWEMYSLIFRPEVNDKKLTEPNELLAI